MKNLTCSILAVLFSTLHETHGQNITINGFFGADFSTASYTPVAPTNFQTMEGSIDTTKTKGLHFITKSLALFGAESETASILDENGQCIMFRNFDGIFRGSLFKFEKGKIVLSRNTPQGAKISITNPIDMTAVALDVSDNHDVDIVTDTSFWVFQDEGQYLGLATHQSISGNILERQDTADYYGGSYLPTHYWIDFIDGGIGEYVHPNGISSAFGILAVTARHQNQMSLHYNGMQLRIRPPEDPYNDFTWIENGNGELGFFGLHDPEITSMNGNLLTVTVWDNGNFRSWNGSYETVLGDIDDDGILDTVSVPTLTAASYSRGLELLVDMDNMTVEILKQYLPIGLFYGGAMGSFKLISNSLYSFNYGMVDGEYPYSPFEAPEPSASLPSFGVATREGDEIAFSGFYPDACVYQFQATFDTIPKFRPTITCTPLGNDMYELAANDYTGDIQWSNGLTDPTITVNSPQENDYLFWETDQIYNRVSNKLTPSWESCLITGGNEVFDTKTQKGTVINRSMLSSLMAEKNTTINNLAGQAVNLASVTTGYYVIGQTLYYIL